MKLSGLKVIDLSVFLPGPYMTRILSDHGATVIKVENEEGGDPARNIGENYGATSTFFHNVNRGKKSVSLNLKTDIGQESLLNLCKDADVFVESFRPGVMKRLGIDYPVLKDINRKLVYCSISAFGQSGPYRDRPAHDLTVQAVSGVQSVTVGADGRPAMTGVAVADIVSALHALSGVLMAVLRARETGNGDYIDISMHESILSSIPNILAPVFINGQQPEVKEGRTTGGAAFYQIYETRDGRYVVLGGQEIKFARNLLNLFGRPDLVELCGLPPGPAQEPVVAFLRARFMTRTMAEWQRELGALDICFAPVNTLPEAFEDPHVRERGFMLHDGNGRLHIGPVERFLEEPSRVDLEVPRHGQHNDIYLKNGNAR